MAFRDRDKRGHFDLGALEIYTRSSVHRLGSRMLEKLLNIDGGDYRGKTVRDEPGNNYQFRDYRNKEVLTVLGRLKVKRAYYYDQASKKGWCPKDTALNIEGSTYSPGVKRIISRVGVCRPFGIGQEEIQELAGIEVNAKAIERECYKLGGVVERFNKQEAQQPSSARTNAAIPKLYICMDGTGVPAVKAETIDRLGKNAAPAKTREAKLGCVFTQTATDEKGRPVRDEGSTSYVGAIETAEALGNRIYEEAQRRGLERALNVCVIGDGAPWIWNIADEQFYGATQIIDLWHAREHYWNVAKVILANDQKKQNGWAMKRREELDQGEVEKVMAAIKRLSPDTEEGKAVVSRELGYFESNKQRMRYADFRKQGLFVGSGVVEAGCRTVIGQRLKQSGMRWTVRGANNIIALRCCLLSNRWEDFWEYQAAA